MQKKLRNDRDHILREHSKEAFTKFFHQYYSDLLEFAMLYVPHFEQAEDIVSNVMVRLIKKIKEGVDIRDFKSFLFISIKNEAFDYLKKEKRRSYVPIDSENDFFLKEYNDPHEKLIEKELRELIFNTVNSFPPKRRTVYKLIKDEKLSYKQVAKILDISERTVGVHITMAGKEVRKVIEKYLQSRSLDQRFLRVAKSLLVLIVG